MDKKVTDMIKEYGSPSGTDDDKKDWKLLDVVQKSVSWKMWDLNAHHICIINNVLLIIAEYIFFLF